MQAHIRGRFNTDAIPDPLAFPGPGRHKHPSGLLHGALSQPGKTCTTEEMKRAGGDLIDLVDLVESDSSVIELDSDGDDGDGCNEADEQAGCVPEAGPSATPRKLTYKMGEKGHSVGVHALREEEPVLAELAGDKSPGLGAASCCTPEVGDIITVNTPVRDTLGNTLGKDTAAKGMQVDDMLVRNTLAEGMVTEDAGVEVFLVKGTRVDYTPVKGTLAKDTLATDTLVADTSVTDTGLKDTPAKDTLGQDTLTTVTPAKETAAKGTGDEATPVGDIVVDDLSRARSLARSCRKPDVRDRTGNRSPASDISEVPAQTTDESPAKPCSTPDVQERTRSSSSTRSFDSPDAQDPKTDRLRVKQRNRVRFCSTYVATDRARDLSHAGSSGPSLQTAEEKAKADQLVSASTAPSPVEDGEGEDEQCKAAASLSSGTVASGALAAAADRKVAVSASAEEAFEQAGLRSGVQDGWRWLAPTMVVPCTRILPHTSSRVNQFVCLSDDESSIVDDYSLDERETVSVGGHASQKTRPPVVSVATGHRIPAELAFVSGDTPLHMQGGEGDGVYGVSAILDEIKLEPSMSGKGGTKRGAPKMWYLLKWTDYELNPAGLDDEKTHWLPEEDLVEHSREVLEAWKVEKPKWYEGPKLEYPEPPKPRKRKNAYDALKTRPVN